MGNEIPMGLALVVCDMHIQDKHTNKKTLVGLFDRLFATSLPCVHPSLSVFVSLTSARGQYVCEVVCKHQETGDSAFAVKGQVRFNDPLQVVEIVFNVQGVRFNHEGTYSLQCLLDDYPVMMRRIIIVRKEAKSGKKD
jgi:hypothetical protein